VAASPRNPMFAPWLDLRAYKIDDPVERLRFLRHEMQALEREPTPVSAHLTGRWKWPVGAGFALVAILAAARPTRVPQPAPQKPPAIAVAAEVPPNEAPKNKNLLAFQPEKVWRVDRSGVLETYSNGLRVDLTFTEPNKTRTPYPVFPLTSGAKPLRFQSIPAGIVYHTTESNLVDFDETQNGRLKQLGRNVLDVVREEHAYHYLIDRFGRVFRVVQETDIADHSGHSVWADQTGIYVNLNASFLAVAFEAQTGESNSVTAAQVQAARMLTEMLRSKYSIPAGNCVTHAQVSVNAGNMRIGNHTDWGSQFPFAAVGLPDNYAQPLPSLIAFGFQYDAAFLQATGGRWKGLDLAEAQVARRAEAQGIPVARYRAVLQHRYSDILGVVAASEEGKSEGGS
jgi:hypothetical protein